MEALRWPKDFGPCVVRIIEVPPELHGRYPHAGALPLYQMIAKNVGIRRSRGRFILATNIDILFSSELASFLSKQSLEPGRMYRIDRHDVMSDVPSEATQEEQLAYCQTHLIRINRREGSFPVLPDGTYALSLHDVASPGAGILFGKGWFPVERCDAQQGFRWAQERAELLLQPPDAGVALLIDLEPGPAGGAPLDLEVVAGTGEPLARVLVDRRSELRLRLPQPCPDRVWLQSHGCATYIGTDPRRLFLRAFRVQWDLGGETPDQGGARRFTLNPVPLLRRIPSAWAALQALIEKMARGGSPVTVAVPVSPRLAAFLRAYVEWGGFTGMARRIWRRLSRHDSDMGAPRQDMFQAGSGVTRETERRLENAGGRVPVSDTPAFLHTNACGDFTLLAREHWLDLRGYPEFDVFSMNLDSVFCFAAHFGGAPEQTLDDPLRIYHIEHGTGSGWTPEGQAKLFERIEAKGLSILSSEQVLAWAAQMHRLNSPMIFNREDWGLSRFRLQETSLSGRPGP